MPLTEFQREVLAVIVGNRSERSHFAGGLVLNATEDSARYSKDFDMFHDEIRDLDATSHRDVESLASAGYEVRKLNDYGEWDKPSSFRKAIVKCDSGQLALDWAHDSAFRFFPIVSDPLLGWRLHLIDMPIGVAFVNEKGEPGWIGSNPDLKIHYGSLRGCWPTMSAVEDEK